MSDAYSEYIEEFSIEISDFNLIGPTAHIPLRLYLRLYQNVITELLIFKIMTTGVLNGVF